MIFSRFLNSRNLFDFTFMMIICNIMNYISILQLLIILIINKVDVMIFKKKVIIFI